MTDTANIPYFQIRITKITVDISDAFLNITIRILLEFHIRNRLQNSENGGFCIIVLAVILPLVKQFLEFNIQKGAVVNSYPLRNGIIAVNKMSDDAAVFNGIKTFSALVLFGVMSIWKFNYNADAIIYGGLYGICLCMSMYCGYKALSLGPLSLTSLIVAFSVVFPLLYGIVFCDEKLTVVRCMGFIFLALAIVAANVSGGASDDTRKINNLSSKWKIFVFATFVCNGLCSVLQKMHQNRREQFWLQ